MAGRATSKAWLFVIAGLLVNSIRADPKCYDTWGNEDANQLPCFSPGTTDTSATTWCCNRNDYCLSNGLCLSPGYNNLMTQQGCTDKAWGGPCNKICSANDENGTGLGIPLIPCPASYNPDTNEFQFCCGPDATSCCSNSISWTSIPLGNIIRSPTISTSVSAASSESTSSSNSYSLKLGLGIGLGIGIPILLVLLAVAYLLAQPLHPRRHRHWKNNNHNKTASRPTLTEKSSSTSSSEKKRRDSFGRVDTNVGPPSDDGHDNTYANVPHVWPPAGGGTNVAAAIAAWALRSGFGIGHHGHGGAPGVEMEAPPPPRPGTPQEMDGRPTRGPPGMYRRSRSRVRTTATGAFGHAAAAAAELPGHSSSEGMVAKGDNIGGRGKVRVAAEEVELPTPDTPKRERDVEKGLGGNSGGGERGRGGR
ncbi:hypothetical protein C8A03DRAFT_35055 [Achaetomium macrosporum]|uniref:Uncharacterized protein n=1 Tax=Achaetomium macrosporum TaxID=79813 RepID=A0AAN7H695_9PEZI|nr:hypothetical protein C8A03DRAFT_35055 [Achaetomium macrosporum]